MQKRMKHQDTKTPRESSESVDRIATEIVDAAYRVRSELGPGLLANGYETCSQHELNKKGHAGKRQVSLPVVDDAIEIDAGYRLDMVVDDSAIIELESVDSVQQIHFAQGLSYLKLGGFELGFLVPFNVTRIKDGIKGTAV